MATGHRRRNGHTSPFRPSKPRTTDPDLENPPVNPGYEPFAFVRFVQDRIERPRFVYFIQEVLEYGEFVGETKYGPVKIGEAFDPLSRLRELQCGNSRNLEVRAVIFATNEAEASLHLRWESVAGIRGEWFGRGFEHAIVELAKRAQAEQARKFQEARRQPYQIAEEAVVTITNPQLMASHEQWMADHGFGL